MNDQNRSDATLNHSRLRKPEANGYHKILVPKKAELHTPWCKDHDAKIST